MLKMLLQDSWSYFKVNYNEISRIIFPVVIPVEIIKSIYEHYLVSEVFSFYEQIFPMTLDFITYPVYYVGVIFFLASKISDVNTDTTTLLKKGMDYWTPFIILYLMLIVLITLGFILFIIPGIILLARYAFADFDLLLNKTKPVNSMRNSWKTTKGYTWAIIGGYALISLILFLPYYFIYDFFILTSLYTMIFHTVFNIVYSVLGFFYTIFSYHVYKIAISTKSQEI